jgi:VanZ family protein
MDSRRVPHAAVALAAAGILAVTLVPGDSVVNAAQPRRVGSEPLSLANLLLNVILFILLGASLVWSRLPALRAVLVGAGLSAVIELAQFAIPGRFPSAMDWAANAAGTGLGVALFRTAPAWLLPPPGRARRLALAAGAVASAVLGGTGILLAPAPSAAVFYGHRTPLLAHLAPYAGTLIDASLDEIEIPHGRIADSDGVRARLGGNFALRLDALAGTPPARLAALLLITDAAQREILLLGQDRDDLVYRFRSRSRLLGLETARLRLPGALRGVDPGDPLELRVERTGAEFCFALDGFLECGHGFTVGDGWLLLAPDHRILTPLRQVLGAAWVAALFVPLGYWGGWNGTSGVAWAIAAAALLLASSVTALLPTPMSQVAGAGCGALLGAACRRQFEGRRQPDP